MKFISKKDINIKSKITINKLRDYTEYNNHFVIVPIIFLVFFFSLFYFLREVIYFVNEREAMNIDNMENMGVSRWKYLFASYLAAVLY